MANINLRDLPDDLYMELKSEAPLAGMGLYEYCFYILRNRGSVSKIKTLLPVNAEREISPDKALRDIFKSRPEDRKATAMASANVVPAAEIKTPVMSLLRPPTTPSAEVKHHPMCKCPICLAEKK